MTDIEITIANNISAVRDNIASACAKYGQHEDKITLMAVSKMQPDEKMIAARNCGLTLFGENLVQEIVRKNEFFSNLGVTCQLIGHLQTNKVKYLPNLVDTIQSVDSLKLAQQISTQYSKHNLTANILIEINIGGEESKSGISPDCAEELAAAAGEMPGVCVKGIMCVPPAVGDESVRKYFEHTRRIFDDIASKNLTNVNMDILSMGMSNDYVYAIAEGSNFIRVGSGIFGARDYSKR